MVSEPELGVETAEIMRIVLVLPAPFGPKKPKLSPRSIAKLTPRTAATSPKSLTMSVASSTGLALTRHRRARPRGRAVASCASLAAAFWSWLVFTPAVLLNRGTGAQRIARRAYYRTSSSDVCIDTGLVTPRPGTQADAVVGEN